MENIGVYITNEDITGKKSSVAEIIHLISRYNLAGVLTAISFINNIVVDSPGEPGIQRELVENIFGEELKRAILAHWEARPYELSTVFHRQQQLLLLKLALLSCPTDGGLPWDEEALHVFCKACLLTSDVVTPNRDYKPDKDLMDYVTMFLSISELPADNRIMALVGRGTDLWINIMQDPEIIGNRSYIPIDDHFKQRYGMGLEEFLNILFVFIISVERFGLKPDRMFLQNLAIQSAELTKGSNVSQEQLERVLNVIAAEPGMLSHSLFSEASQSLQLDLTVLRRYPIIKESEGRYLCYDRGLLRKFLTDGVYWLVAGTLPESEKSNFQSFFGAMFELYASRLFRHVFDPSGSPFKRGMRAYINPEFSKQQGAGGSRTDEVCDILIDCNGKTLILVEVKGSLIPTRAKYSGNKEVLQRDIDARYVERERKPVGVGQLAKNIKRLLSGDTIKNIDIDVSRYSTIYPVIVAYESVVAGPALPAYLQTHLSRLLSDSPLAMEVVRPMNVLSSDDLESYSTISHKHDLHHLLAHYNLVKNPATIFGNFLIDNYKGDINRHDSWIGQRYDQMGDSVKSMLGF